MDFEKAIAQATREESGKKKLSREEEESLRDNRSAFEASSSRQAFLDSAMGCLPSRTWSIFLRTAQLIDPAFELGESKVVRHYPERAKRERRHYQVVLA